MLIRNIPQEGFCNFLKPILIMGIRANRSYYKTHKGDNKTTWCNPILMWPGSITKYTFMITQTWISLKKRRHHKHCSQQNSLSRFSILDITCVQDYCENDLWVLSCNSRKFYNWYYYHNRHWQVNKVTFLVWTSFWP